MKKTILKSFMIVSLLTAGVSAQADAIHYHSIKQQQSSIAQKAVKAILYTAMGTVATIAAIYGADYALKYAVQNGLEFKGYSVPQSITAFGKTYEFGNMFNKTNEYGLSTWNWITNQCIKFYDRHIQNTPEEEVISNDKVQENLVKKYNKLTNQYKQAEKNLNDMFDNPAIPYQTKLELCENALPATPPKSYVPNGILFNGKNDYSIEARSYENLLNKCKSIKLQSAKQELGNSFHNIATWFFTW